jgi:hypothetical protein
MNKSNSNKYKICLLVFISISIVIQLCFNIKLFAQSDSVILNQKDSIVNSRKYQPKTGIGISLSSAKEQINFFVISATEAKTMWFELDYFDKWIDSLTKVNIKVVNNVKPDTTKWDGKFRCFDGTWYMLLRMHYGDTLRLVYNAYSQKSNNGIKLDGSRASICNYQFYDDSGKPISTKEYEVLMKRKNKWWRRIFLKKLKW